MFSIFWLNALLKCKLVGNIGLSASSESIYQCKHSRSATIRHRPHRVSLRRNKENGSGSHRRKNSFKKSTATDGIDKVLKVSFQNLEICQSLLKWKQTYQKQKFIKNENHFHSITGVKFFFPKKDWNLFKHEIFVHIYILKYQKRGSAMSSPLLLGHVKMWI